jgi:tryptophanyl-tRNA synthetase
VKETADELFYSILLHVHFVFLCLGDVAKIRSLRNPQAKMSKSEANPLSRIELTDTPDEIAEKIKKAVTDMTSEVTYEPEQRPGVSNLIDIHIAFSGQFAEEVVEDAYLKVRFCLCGFVRSFLCVGLFLPPQI